jgi:hypothetical protein
MLQTWCQIQRTTPSLRYVNCGPGHIQCISSSAYSDFNIRQNVSELLLYISRQFNARYTASLVPNTAHIVQITLCGLWSRAYTRYLQLSILRLQYSAVGVCAFMVDITWIRCALYCKLCAKYSAQPQFTVCELWCRPYTMHLQLRIFRLHYSSQGRSPAIGGISSIQWALYCKVGANYSPHPTVYAMWTVVPDIYNVFTAPHIQALIYDRKYLRCYWR